MHTHLYPHRSVQVQSRHQAMFGKSGPAPPSSEILIPVGPKKHRESGSGTGTKSPPEKSALPSTSSVVARSAEIALWTNKLSKETTAKITTIALFRFNMVYLYYLDAMNGQ